MKIKRFRIFGDGKKIKNLINLFFNFKNGAYGVNGVDGANGANGANGIVLTMVLYILIIFVIIGLVLVTLMIVNNQASYQLLYSTQAYYLTEAGIEYGLYQIKDDYVWNDGTPASNLATGISFNPPGQINCFFSVGFSATGVQNGILTSLGSVPATQIISLDKTPAQRVVSVNVPRIY